jgi:Zn2+/Cd2+-exporting ATPase
MIDRAKKSNSSLKVQVAAALESVSEHPIGSAIVRAAQKQGWEWTEAVNVRSQTGRFRETRQSEGTTSAKN